MDADIAAAEAGNSDDLQLMRLHPDRCPATASGESVSPSPNATFSHAAPLPDVDDMAIANFPA